MGRHNSLRFLWLVIALGWSVVWAFLFRLEREPLTGLGVPGYVRLICLEGLLVGLAAYFVCNRKWRVLGTIVGFVALLLALPMPSMAGLALQVENQTDVDTVISVARIDADWRRVDLPVHSGRKFNYRTTAGDWPSSAGLVFRSDTNQIVATILALRRVRVVLTSHGFQLEVLPQIQKPNRQTNPSSL